MRSVAITALLLVGCAEKSIELQLTWPEADSDVANMDISCVNSVHVVVDDEELGEFTDTCIEVTSPTSYEDLQAQIRGKLQLDLPDNTAAITVRGQAFANFCSGGMNVFFAGGAYTGNDLTLRVEGTMDCSAIKTTGSLKIRPVDFLALANTAAGSPPVCSPITLSPDPFSGAPPSVTIGLIRPTNIDLPELEFDTSIFDAAALPGAQNGSPINMEEGVDKGTAITPLLEEALPTSCLAIGDRVSYGVSCVYPGTPTVCAQAGEVEFPYISSTAAFDSRGTAESEGIPLVYGIVYDIGTGPVAGATVTLAEGRGTVEYATPSGGVFVPNGGTVTDASGAFLAYMREPSVITVKEGLSTKSMRIGAVSYGGSAVIVPLR